MNGLVSEHVSWIGGDNVSEYLICSISGGEPNIKVAEEMIVSQYSRVNTEIIRQ